METSIMHPLWLSFRSRDTETQWAEHAHERWLSMDRIILYPGVLVRSAALLRCLMVNGLEAECVLPAGFALQVPVEIALRNWFKSTAIPTPQWRSPLVWCSRACSIGLYGLGVPYQYWGDMSNITGFALLWRLTVGIHFHMVMAFGFRLPFRQNAVLLLLGSLFLTVTLTSSMCSMVEASPEEPRMWLYSVIEVMPALTEALFQMSEFQAVGGPPVNQAMCDPQLCPKFAVFVHFILGFLMGAYLMWFLEFKERTYFLRRTTGTRVTPPWEVHLHFHAGLSMFLMGILWMFVSLCIDSWS